MGIAWVYSPTVVFSATVQGSSWGPTDAEDVRASLVARKNTTPLTETLVVGLSRILLLCAVTYAYSCGSWKCTTAK
jgi:hypothetical protein